MKSDLTVIDRVVLMFSPEKAWRRTQYRDAIKMHYDGATRTRRGKSWRNSNAGPASVTEMGLDTLRARSRDMARNNGWAVKAINVLCGYLVGSGVVGSITNNEDLDALFKDWSTSIEVCSSDMNDLAGVQNLAIKSMFEGGEVLIRRRWRRNTDGYKIPFQIELLEAEYIDTAKNGTAKNGNSIVQGVEFNKIGKRVAYWLFNQHPNDMQTFTTYESKRVKASDIIHLFEIERIGQVRGIPRIAPVILPMKDFEDYEDAQLMRQKIASCFTGFVHGNQVAGPAGQNSELPIDKLQPGFIGELPDGKNITFANPPSVEGYGEYSANQLRKFAAGMGITYEDLSGDYSGFNFSSARMSRGAMFKNLDPLQRNILIQRLCGGVAKWFLEAAFILGFETENAKFRWTKPRREMVDPAKEIPVIIKMVRSGLTSLTDAIISLGYDPEDVFNQIKTDNEIIDKHGFILDSDARKVSLSGVGHSINPTESENEDE